VVVDASTIASELVVLWPVFPELTAALAQILEVGAAKVLVLLDVEPEVESVFGTLPLEKEIETV
jgi:hypothetical protein